MANQFIQKIGPKEFRLVYDPIQLKEAIQALKTEYDEYFLPVGAMPDEGVWLSRQVYEQNVEDFLRSLDNQLNDTAFEVIIDSLPKKKDGSFKKRSVKILADCQNARYISDWHNTWIYYQLRAKVIDDYVCALELYEIVDTPG